MTDIIISMPWTCGDKDCPVGWHLGNYWCDTDGTGTGYTYDAYSDGDHEEVEESDLPPFEEVARAWADYACYVSETGKDPLGNFPVKQVRKVRERWAFRFSYSILGWMVVQAKRAGHIYAPYELPPHVRQYLNLPDQGAPVLGDFTGTEGKKQFEELFPKPHKWNVQTVEHDQPRASASVRRELISAAKRVPDPGPPPPG